jgi:hypothetical protein
MFQFTLYDGSEWPFCANHYACMLNWKVPYMNHYEGTYESSAKRFHRPHKLRVKACLFYFFTMNAYMHFLMPFIVNVA